jgi:8-oxo-dGTP pyrophosphatase MutT (NUDIX family)
MGTHWSFPKGTIEDGETFRDTALRELFEETGISQVEFIEGFAKTMKYSFILAEDGTLVQKEVAYFLARTSEKAVKLSWEHLEYKWLPFPKALATLTHENSKEFLTEAEDFLQRTTTISR